MLKKLLLCTLLSTSLTACQGFVDSLEPPLSGMPCRPNQPCHKQAEPDVYGKLDSQMKAAATENPPAAEIAPLPEISDSEEQTFMAIPVEPIDGIGIEGRRLSPDVAIAAAAKGYKKTGKAKPIIGDNVITYPYGIGEAKVVCVQLHACMVEFQPGEAVSNIVVGDAENWSVEHISSGMGSNAKDMVVLKALYGGDTSTNMMVTSDRRIYNITLVSRDGGEYTPRVNFYYPQDMVVVSQKRQEEDARLKAMQTPTFAASPADLNFNYELEDTKGKPWAPVRVFDDGRKVYIQMKKTMDVTEAPVLFEQSKKGQLSIVNYRVQGDYFIVDKLFKTAVLKLGEDNSEMVKISRKG